jgi:GT2 family glycosyltransferase
MSTDLPEITVSIPTYNRCADLNRILNALSLQTYPFKKFEVLVVADGCIDHTIEMLRNYRAPFRLRTIDQSNQGPAAARNHGMSLAHGKVLLFLDDDVEPTPSLIEAHMEAHRCVPGGIVIGPYPLAFQGQGFLHVESRAWWDRRFTAMLQPGHRFSFSDLLSGNFSISARLLSSFNGFDTAFRVHEDYELGMRLIKAGVPFTAAPRALAYHYEKSDLDLSCTRKRLEGCADVKMARLHPEFSRALPIARPSMCRFSAARILRIAAFTWPAAGDGLASVLRAAMDALEGVRLRRRWRQLSTLLHQYWYWRGAASEAGTRRALRNILQQSAIASAQPAEETEIDLGNGLEHAEQRLDEERPAAVRIRFGAAPIGTIPHQPGAEAIRGVHLRSYLAESLAVPLLMAMAREGRITKSATIDSDRLSDAISARSHWFGPTRPGQMWHEQYSQWNELERGNRR